MVGQLADRAAYRSLRQQIQVAVDAAGGADKPLHVRGAEPSHSGTGNRTITLTNGLWCAAEDNPPAAAGDAPEVYFGDSTGASYVLDANTSGSVYRRDILQLKIDAETTTQTETRDMKDAVTGVVTTQSYNKRRVRTATISVKKGTDQSSEALADANEPTPDSGYVKIFSFLVDNTGACDAAKRKRYTIGCRRRVIAVSALNGWANPYSGLNNTGYFNAAGGSGDSVMMPIPMAVGDRIRAVRFTHRSEGSGTIGLEVKRISSAGILDDLNNILGSGWELFQNFTPDSTTLITEITGPDYILAADEWLFAKWSAGDVNDRCHGVHVVLE